MSDFWNDDDDEEGDWGEEVSVCQATSLQLFAWLAFLFRCSHTDCGCCCSVCMNTIYYSINP